MGGLLAGGSGKAVVSNIYRGVRACMGALLAGGSRLSSVGAPGPFISLISMLELEPRLARVRV